MKIFPFILALGAIAGIAGCRAADVDPVNVADPGAIAMVSGQVPYVGSLNDDDDDADRRLDLSRSGPPPASEDNLRKLTFYIPDANWVYISEPINLTTQRSAIGAKIRAWDKTRGAPFQFGQTLPTSAADPLTVYIEGIQTSAVDEIGFEYQYFRDRRMQQTVGGGASRSTVVQVSFAGGGRTRGLTPRQKLLAKGDLSTAATVSPKLPNARYLWTYDNATNGSFEAATAATLASKFSAQARWTAVRDQDLARFRVTDPRTPGGPIEVAERLNIVAPRSVTPNPPTLPDQPGTLSTRGIINQDQANNTRFRLFRWRVEYTVLDQFGDNIYDAEKGGAKVQVREDVPIGSPIPGLNAWFAGSTTTPVWKDILASGRFPDRLASDRGQGIPYATVMNTTPGSFALLTNTDGQEIVRMEHHVWHVTVDRAQDELDKRVTDNALRVRVSSYRAGPPQEADFISSYTIRLTP